MGTVMGSGSAVRRLAKGILVCLWAAGSGTAQTPMTCGQAVSGTISAAKQKDSYTFSGAAGDRVTIRAAATSGSLMPYLELFGPTGQRVGTGAVGPLDATLSATGTHTVSVSDISSTNTGGYTLVWQRLNSPCNATALGCGRPVAASLSAAGEVDFYTFAASAGDVLTIRVSGGLSSLIPVYQVYDPTGTSLSQFNFQKLDMTAQRSGTYTLAVSGLMGTETGAYSLTWQRLNRPCQPRLIACNAPVSGSLSSPAELAAFVLRGTAGDQLRMTVQAGSGLLLPTLDLYSSAGVSLASGASPLDRTLPYTGPYFLFLGDSFVMSTGSYTLSAAPTNRPCTPPSSTTSAVFLIAPAGGEVFTFGSTVAISWLSVDAAGVASHEVRLSTDGGATFPTVLAAGLPGDATQFDWQQPSNVLTRRGRIRVIARNAAGASVQDESAGDFSIVSLGAAQLRTVAYQYDNLQRLTKASYPDGATIAYTYDAAGNITSITRASSALVNAASYQAGAIAADAIVSLFGAGLATATAAAEALPLPTSLAGTEVSVRDSAGVTRKAGLFFVSPTQINLLVPSGTATGAAEIRVGGTSLTVQVDRTGPGLFSATASGKGVAAGSAIHVAPDQSQRIEPLYAAVDGSIRSVPIDLGSGADQVYLMLFGTGIRHFATAISATIGGQSVGAVAVPQGSFAGLDQVNLGPLPRSLKGRGELDIIVTVDGKRANAVTVNIQ